MQDTATIGMLVYLLVCLVLSVVVIAAQWIIFTKAGEAGWKIFIPFYANYIQFKITWGNGWLFLLLCVPVVNAVVSIMYVIKLAQCFGKGGGYAVGLIFLPFIFMPMLAFGDAQYLGPQ